MAPCVDWPCASARAWRCFVCQADETTLRARLAARADDPSTASDARLEIWPALRAAFTEPSEIPEAVTIDATAEPGEMVDQALAALRAWPGIQACERRTPMDVQRDGYRGNGPPFQDRAHAGALPANRLEAYRGKDALILGIPRGGVPVAAEVAHRLGAELDVVVARKLPATISPELAIGAVTANGGRFLNEETIEALGISDVDLERVMAEQRAEARRREERFRDGRPLPRIEGRTVVVVDDGLATGATIRAALRSVRRSQLRRLVAAVPVGSRQAVAALCEEAHEVVCLVVPSPFLAVGLYYGHFEPTEDADVQRIQDERRATGPCPRSRVG